MVMEGSKQLIKKNLIISNFVIFALFILISKALGFLRSIFIAKSIGTSNFSDAYLQVFGVSTLLFTSIGIALSSVSIPIFTQYLTQESEEDRKEYISNLFSQVTLITSIITVIGIMFAPWITKLILPGISGEAYNLSISLTRIMFPTLIFICLAYIVSGVLQVHKHFVITSLISIPFNLIIILFLIIYEDNIIYLGYVTAAGWLLQLLVQLPILFKEKYKLSFHIDFTNKHIRQIYANLVPILLGNAVLQLCVITDRAIVNSINEGYTSALSYGSEFFMTVTSIFIVAISTVAFPDISKYCIEKDFEKVRKLVGYIIKVLLLITIPYLVVVSFYSNEIITLIYKRGAFTYESARLTSLAFLLYSFCVVGYMAQEVFNRVYYALKKYYPPMLIGAICILLNVIIDLLVYKSFGIVGIVGSTAICFLIYTLLMNYFVGKEIGNFLDKETFIHFCRVLVGAVGMLAVFLLFKFLNLSGMFKSFILPLLIGGGVYILLAYCTKTLEVIFRGERELL